MSVDSSGRLLYVATSVLGAARPTSYLRPVAAFGPQRNGPATNGIKADVVDRILWVTDSMAGAVACAPRTCKDL